MTDALPTNYQKHQSENPIQRWLIDRFNKRLIAFIYSCSGVKSIFDVGCGEGFTLALIQKAGINATLSGIDASKEALRLGKKEFPKLQLSEGDIYHLKAKSRSVDLVLCTEVLEHLTDPISAIGELKRVARKYVIISVPHEPWFMLANFLRGKYLTRWGNHPEHINHWSKAGIVHLVESQGLHIVRVANPFAWTLILAKLV